MVIVVPIYEEAMTGVYYNAAAVIDADGSYLGKYRKTHIPQVAGLGEIFLQTRVVRLSRFPDLLLKLGVYICYDGHSLKGGERLRSTAPNTSSIRRRPLQGSPSTYGNSNSPRRRLNGIYIGAINRVGSEAPWNIGDSTAKAIL